MLLLSFLFLCPLVWWELGRMYITALYIMKNVFGFLFFFLFHKRFLPWFIIRMHKWSFCIHTQLHMMLYLAFFFFLVFFNCIYVCIYITRARTFWVSPFCFFSGVLHLYLYLDLSCTCRHAFAQEVFHVWIADSSANSEWSQKQSKK